MKQLKFGLLVAFLALGNVNAKAQTADEIIQKHITAIGGVDNWKKVSTMKITGAANAGGQEIPIIMTKQQGKGFKMEYTFNGMTGYMIMTDKTGWNFSPFGGQAKAEVIPDETIKQAQDELDIQGPLIDYQAKGNKVTYLGKDEVEGTECYKLKVVSKSGKETTMYFDANTYYEIKAVAKLTANGKETEQTQQMGNYQKLPEGIVVAMSLDGGNGAVTVKSVEINKPLADNFFMPGEAETQKK